MTYTEPPDDEDERRRTRDRLEIVNAAVWAVEHGHELLDIVSAAATAEQAVTGIMRAGAVSQDGASAIMAMQLRRWPAEQVQRLKDEQRQLLEELGEVRRSPEGADGDRGG